MGNCAALAFVMGLVLSGFSSAGVLYSNFGPGDSYHTDSGTFINQKPSLSVVAGSGQWLGEIDFAASLFDSGSLNQVTVSLSDDVFGHPAASALASHVFTGALSLTPAILQWTLTSAQPLVSGNTYWVTLDASPGAVVWNYNDQVQAGDSRLISGVWTPEPGDTQGAIRILTADAPVPEPATWLLFGGAFGVMVLRLAKRPAGCEDRA
jgi:hypothetical protein